MKFKFFLYSFLLSVSISAQVPKRTFDTIPAAGEIVFLKNVSFESDTSLLQASAYDELNDLVNMLKKHSTLKIDIEGYCTDFQHVPTQSRLVYSKTRKDNSERSKLYSQAVYDYLVRQGIAAHRLNYVGYGELESVANSETPEGREANRRVAITIPLEPIEIIYHGKGKSVSNCEHSSCQIRANDSTTAQFPNGEKALRQYLKTHLKYPRFFYMCGVEGTGYITFIVTKEGTLQNIEVSRAAPCGGTEQAIRLVQGMPKWIPATKNGEKVCSRFTLPIKFKID